MGKTALAAHWGRRVADQFPDGQLWVNLRGYDPGRGMPPEQALAVLLRGLGVSGAQIPPDLDGRVGLYRSLLDGRRMLVVLDNAGSAEQVRSLLPGARGCLVVVTSRDDLAGLVARDGATRIRLDLLAQVESVALLRRLLGPAVVNADLAAIAELARLCARLPLALRIAADRVALDGAPLPEVVAQLANERRLDVFAAGGDPYTAVRAVFSWSYRALSPPIAGLFRVLGLVPGADWDTYAAAALADCSLADARRLLGVLVAAHLVEDRGAGRFSMHDLLRAYATERAEAADTEPARHAALTRLFDHYLGTAASAMDTAFPHEQHRRPRVRPSGTPVPPVASSGQALAWLDAERPNLVAAVGHAVEHGWPTHAAHLSTTLYRYLIAGAHLADAFTVHGRGLDAARATGDRVGEATALHSLGSVCDEWGRHEEALAYYEHALTINRELDNRTGEAYTLGNLGVVYRKMGRYEEAVEHYRQVLTISRERGDRASETTALGNLGTIHLRCGRYAEARDHYRETLGLAQETGDRASEAGSLSGLGSVYARWGRPHEALDHYQRALTIIREIGIRAAEADVLCELGSIHLRLARYDDALDCCRQAVTISRETGNRVSEADAVYRFGAICLRRAEYDEADAHYREALAIANEVGYRGIEPHSLNGQGEVCRATARPAEAFAHHQTALNAASELGERFEQARAWDGLAHAHHDLGDHATARQHWQRALMTYVDLGVPEAEETRAKLDGT